MHAKLPRIIVFSSLFPSAVRPNAGVFIRERMFRVGKQLPVIVISPVPWFPLQGVLRRWKPNFRPQPAKIEKQNGIRVYFPRFFSMPFFFKALDGFFMALGSFLTLYKIKKEFDFDLIDAHFAYPDGYAATRLGQWLKVPVTITLRGTEVPLSKMPERRKRILKALLKAAQVFSVSDSLKRHVVALGADSEKILVVGNGVDTSKFYPLNKHYARSQLNIDEDALVLISVGALVDRKGFHRVIEVLPALIEKFPSLIYLIVGGDSPEGNMHSELQNLVYDLRLEKQVKFLGAMPAEQLKTPLSAADLFVLATANEGWANVFLEAMACGLPVITTDVGGNREVVSSNRYGIIVPFGNAELLANSLDAAIEQSWDREQIIAYAKENSWEKRVQALLGVFNGLVRRP